MSTTPGQFPFEPEEPTRQEATDDPAWAEPDVALPPEPSVEPLPLLFRQYTLPEMPEESRIPNMGHVGILVLIALCGLFAASMAARIALEFHLFGVTTLTQAANEIHYTLGTEAIFYVLTFLGSLLIFPVLWHKGFFAGLQWRGRTALALRSRLISAAVVCFLLALANGMLIPGPENAPIDRIFRMPGAAWLLFGFGVTAAPFFEELAFRGFLLPAFCTAFDWAAETFWDAPPRYLDENEHPQWSKAAMGVASVMTSVLFALLHGDQTGYAFGPFLLLVCVSLVLSWARLGTKSLAASVLVHASYNFILFSFMFLGTSGFRHLDKL
ncbi:MAG: CPBP family intramembrane glutamic endopeptidase [Terracidiphilus sp.]